MTEHVKIYGVIPKKQYVADGTITTFDFPFAFFNDNDIVVYFNSTVQDADTYTVTGARNSDGGSVTFTTAPESGVVITIMRNLSIERLSDFQEGGALRADTLNDELDYQIACAQQIAENLNRSMVLPPYAVATDVNLTLPTPSAGKAIVWNADGTNLENSTVEVNAMESTLRGYKESAESAASTATTKAGIASDKADIATSKAAEAAASMVDKANKDMDNLSAAGKEKVANLSMPSSSYIDLALTSAHDTYTAPADGYIWTKFTRTGTTEIWSVLSIKAYVSGILQEIYVAQSIDGKGNTSNVLPIQKGQIAEINFGTGTSITESRFIYAEGEI